MSDDRRGDAEDEGCAPIPDLPEAIFEPLEFERLPLEEMRRRGAEGYAELERRRTTREFSADPVTRDLIELAIRSAGTAPSGAHRQPWTFEAVGDAELKRRIREAAEEEERRTYTERMREEWRRALAPLGTDWVKSHITGAPWVVFLFKRSYELLTDGSQGKNY